ncbi:MAG: hypothetical protein NTX23_06540 [Candidatus Bipolaricaulota bacterium]|nr:hypothetical protein [Candidatus Bipolaricaulota bacterium]
MKRAPDPHRAHHDLDPRKRRLALAAAEHGAHEGLAGQDPFANSLHVFLRSVAHRSKHTTTLEVKTFAADLGQRASYAA